MKLDFIKKWNFLPKKILIVFSDPGGAKPLLSLAYYLKMEGKELKIISDREYDFYNEFRLNVSKPQVVNDFENFKPEVLITGTSYTSNIEIQYIENAKKNGIISYSFIDHYTRIKNRFFNSNTYTLPNYIIVIDKFAKNIAIKEGFKSNSVFIISNPYHYYLENWTPIINKKRLLDELGLMINKMIIVYAPDPISNAGGIEKFGTDEVQLSKFFMETLEEFESHSNLQIIVVPHKNQNLSLLKNIFKGSILNIHFFSSDKLIELLYFSDLVIGIFSNILVEALVLKKPVLRILNNISNDPFEKVQIGKLCYNKSQLKNQIVYNYNTFSKNN